MIRIGTMFAVASVSIAAQLDARDIGSAPADLTVPAVTNDAPAPGKRVRQFNPDYAGSSVYHLLYLPSDWKAGEKYPVIVEYAGNKYKTSLGTVEGSSLGYGISGGTGVIWICMPYVNKQEMKNQVTWWGDVEATVSYCKHTVKRICDEFGGDAENVFIAGFSRGAIACNYIGLHDDEIGALWRGFICHSHYDGVKMWSYAHSDRDAAAGRLKRLGERPQFISQENSVDVTRTYLLEAHPSGNFTFLPLKGATHTDTWVLRDIPERRTLRTWFSKVLNSAGKQDAAEKSAAVNGSQPNIVLFFVDDMGWSDLGYRNPVFESPHIDQLASEGLDFEQAYIACPTCSPSRATLLTGKHPARLKLVRHIPNDEKNGFDQFGRTDQEFNLWDTDPVQFPCVNWLGLEHTTYAEALRELGYYNLFVGKWHLGHERYHPIHQGFDRQIGTSNAGHPRSYYPPYFKNSDVMADEKVRYLTDKLTDETVGFIEQYDQQQPFMLSCWYYSVHGPHQGRPDLVKHFEKKGLSGKQAHYAAMVKAVDESVGRVRDAIKKKGIEEETMIIFLSDQGGYFENPPFQGGKRIDTLFEGGARVPLIIYWPGTTQPHTKNISIVQSTDLFPTLIEIAGGDPSKFEDLDGVSLLSTIQNNQALKRAEPIYGYRAYEDLYGSVRSDAWKLLAYRSGTVKLYNIADDIHEENDLAKANPAKTKELLGKFVEWEREMGVEKYSGVQ